MRLAASIYRTNWKKGESYTDFQWVLQFAAHCTSHWSVEAPDAWTSGASVTISCSGLLPLPLSILPGYHLSSYFPTFRFFFCYYCQVLFLSYYPFIVVLILVVFQEGAGEYVCICRLTESALSSFSRNKSVYQETDIPGTESQKKTWQLCPLHC